MFFEKQPEIQARIGRFLLRNGAFDLCVRNPPGSTFVPDQIKEDRTMRSYKGGQTVQPGFYASIGRRELLNFEETEQLPGTQKDTFYALPVILVLIAGPMIGLLYVMFLPFISIAMVTTLLSKKVAYRIAPNRFRKPLPVEAETTVPAKPEIPVEAEQKEKFKIA
jgi:hypothetical protein